jgi:hypothetical protein
LRDVVDQEIDRRVDEDLVDTVCDLLEHLSSYLSEETGDQDSTAPMDADSGCSNVGENRHADIAEAAYRRAEQRQFEPGHDLEDWLAAERALAQR